MRTLLVSFGLSSILAVMVSQPAWTWQVHPQRVAAAAVQTTQTPAVPDRDIKVDINVNRTGGGYWYRNPLWIGIGALAVIVLLLVVVLAARGGGTTIIRE